MSADVETMAFANAVPWHGLGNRVDASVGIDEMLAAAGLNWEVELKPLYVRMDERKFVRVDDRFALTRQTDGQVFTITGPSWKPMQNRDTMEFMRDYTEAGGATLETAGALRGGKVIWCLAKLKHSFDVRKGDRVEGYLLITSPHEVGRCIDIRTTCVRVVCANTMAAAMNDNGAVIHWRQNHLSDFDVNAAKANIALAHDQLAAAQTRYQRIAKLKLSLEDAIKKVLVPITAPGALEESDDVMAMLMLTENQPKALQQIIQSIGKAPGAEAGTGWGVLNGVTHWADHVAGREKATRMFRSWMGDTAKMKVRAEELLLELAA